MKPFNQQEVTARFSRLPKEVQGIILSEEISNGIKEATEAVGLEGEKKKECVQQITLVSVGLATTNDFRNYLQNESGLDSENVMVFEEGITRTIFAPIKRALLTSLEQKNDSGASGENTQQAGTTTDPYREPDDR